MTCNANLVNSLDPESLLDVVNEFDGLLNIQNVERGKPRSRIGEFQVDRNWVLQPRKKV